MSPTTSYTLDPEEEKILDFVESWTWKNPENFEEIKEDLILSAREYMQKKPITIRFPKGTLDAIRARAEREGMPYQTLIVSTMHKYVQWDLVQK